MGEVDRAQEGGNSRVEGFSWWSKKSSKIGSGDVAHI